MAKRVSNMKKTVIFIVEGTSDKRALEKIFQTLYKGKNIKFNFTGGDITSNEDAKKEDVCERIYQRINDCIKDMKLKKSDIWQIVQIFDTDGTFIPDSAAVSGGTKDLFYSLNHISCKSVQKIVDRNQKKRELMSYLLSQQDINGIPYTAYYMSCNLDHALYNKQNLDREVKGAYADAFYTEFIGNEELFVEFLEEEVVNGVPESFPASWRYIKDGVNSLGRHTNLHIYFKQNPYR